MHACGNISDCSWLACVDCSSYDNVLDNNVLYVFQEVRFVDVDDDAIAALNEEIALQSPAPNPSLLTPMPQHSLAMQAPAAVQLASQIQVPLI